MTTVEELNARIASRIVARSFVPERLRLDADTSESVTLSNGRVLIRTGEVSWRVNGVKLTGMMWTGIQSLCVITSLDDCRDGLGPLLHVAVAYHDHLPDWETMHAVRDAFYPDDVDVMMMLPRRQNYVNDHEFSLHMFQTPAAWPRKV
jgi:hypothetical protein